MDRPRSQKEALMKINNGVQFHGLIGRIFDGILRVSNIRDRRDISKMSSFDMLMNSILTPHFLTAILTLNFH